MPGPGNKSKSKKKSGAGANAPAPIQSAPARSERSLAQDIEHAFEWDLIALTVCEYFKIPDLSTRSGLKRIHKTFDTLWTQIDHVYKAEGPNYPKLVAGIVMVWAKMCNDYLLRDKLFKKGFLDHIYPLLEHSETAQVGMRSLASVTRMGGQPFRLAVARETSRVVKAVADYPEDIKLCELAITTLAHCIASIADIDDPVPADLAKLKKHVPEIIRVVLIAVRHPQASGYLLAHAHELFVHLCFNCSKEILKEPACVRYIISFLRSESIAMRGATFRAIRCLVLKDAVQDRTQIDPNKDMQLLKKPWPPEVKQILYDYGMEKVDITMRLKGVNAFTQAMMAYAQERSPDRCALGKKIAHGILQTEFAVVEGGFQSQNPQTGQLEMMDLGLGFTRWTDALPLCAKAIRDKGKPNEQDMADVLDLKFLVARERLSDAVSMAKRSIQRSPECAYFYYIVSLSADYEVALRHAKRGGKCKETLAPFLKHALLHRAVDHAYNLATKALSESAPGHQQWKDGIGFLRGGIDDCRAYIASAPPDQRQMKTVINQYILLMPVAKGPLIDEKLSQLQNSLDLLRVAESCSKHLNMQIFNTDARLAARMIMDHYAAAAKEWGDLVHAHDEYDKQNVTKVEVEGPEVRNTFDQWVLDVQAPEDPKDKLEPVCEHPRLGGHTMQLYSCANCGNPSAVLRKCSRCDTARYCDNQCQTAHWSEHKALCKPEKK